MACCFSDVQPVYHREKTLADSFPGMKIGLIADSHIPEAMPELPSQVRTVFAGVDLIVHAGDLHCLAVLD